MKKKPLPPLLPLPRLSKLLAIVLVLVLPMVLGRDADAFCGFYVSGADAKLFNDATQVVLMREGTRTALSMQNTYKGPAENFAMIVPVPVVLQKANVKTLKKELFEKLDRLTAPRLVEYWEQDPCAPMTEDDEKGAPMKAAMGGASREKSKKEDLGVKVEAQFTVGEYEVVILSAQDAAGLDTWLKREKYKIPEGAEPYLKPYVQSGSKFFVARVDVKKVKFDSEGRVDLSPLRFHYDSTELALPVRLGLINSAGTQDLIVHILAQGQRYEPANYPSVTIPTNLDVTGGAKERFGSFYASLYDRTLEKNPKAIVTEYAWDASTCDPCPGPTLDAGDLGSLGADAMPSTERAAAAAAGGGAPTVSKGRGGPRFGSFVITRLHARYSKSSLGQDIVFKAAAPIAGGREVMGANGQLEHGPQSAPVNNFQGRYAIRHAWPGPIACKDPHRGIWGGPPGGGEPPPSPATRTAFAARNIPLAQLVARDVPELDVKAANSDAPLPPPPSSAAPTASAPSPSVPAAPKQSGCGGCVAAGMRMSGDDALVALGVVVLALARRVRRRAIAHAPTRVSRGVSPGNMPDLRNMP